MADDATVAAAKRSLGAVGAMLPNIPFTAQPTLDEQRAAAVRLERAGYPTAWANEGVGGKDAFVQIAVLLSATERLTVAGGVLNMWARPPQTAHGAASYLAQAFPGRFVAGFGIGYPFQAESVGAEFRSPAETARRYLERLTVAEPICPPPDVSYATVLAANGPRMLAVAAEAADGALPAVQPPELTARARRRLGPDRLLAVGLPVVLGTDRESARPRAREFIAMAAGTEGSPYGANLRRLGFSEQDVRDGSDAVVEAVVAFGTPADVARTVRAHRDAGADHVRLDPVVEDFETGVGQLEQLGTLLSAPAL